jgi:hypothetical protein
MTFVTLTAALALSATVASAQVPPVPPPATAPPVQIPATPPVPAAPVVAPTPAWPMFEIPDFDIPDFVVPEFDLPDAAMSLDIDHALMNAELAFAAMPPMDALHAQLADASRAMAEAGFDHAGLLDEARAGLMADRAGFWGSQRGSFERDRENAAYERGRSALDRRNWDDAVTRFEQVIALKGSRADAALYWKAYAQSRLGKVAEAQATIAALRSGYPKSRYLSDASALEVELKRGGGQAVSPEGQQDEDLKLLAIQGLQHSDPEQAIPLIEKILASSNGPRVKERALYVLALSDSSRAREILLGIAKGGANPDLQRRAIDYLAMHNRREGQSLLEEVYKANSDPEVRMRVLRAYMSAGDRARLLAAAQNEENEELRLAAIRYLGSSGGETELSQLYAKEASKAIRVQIVRSIAASGGAGQLQQIARTETDPEVRQQVIRAFAAVGRERTGTALRDMYTNDASPETRRAIIQAMHAQDDAEGLVAIARRETDPKLKEQIVRSLSTMTKSKVALDYLMELLNK